MTAAQQNMQPTALAWSSIAPGFDEYVTPGNLRNGQDTLDRLRIEPGMRVLDVAAGTGALSIPAARLGATVVAIDVAPVMIERLVARAHAEGLDIDGRVMDGQALDFEEGSFDLVVTQHGVTMFPDLEAGLSELVRVLRPGGHALVTAFGPAPKAEFLALFISAVRVAVPSAPVPQPEPPPPPFRLADPAVFAERLTAAALTGVSIEEQIWDMPFDSAEHLWNWVTSSNPIGVRMVAGLDPAQRADILGVLDGILRERSGGSPGTVLHAQVNVGVGTKPAAG